MLSRISCAGLRESGESPPVCALAGAASTMAGPAVVAGDSEVCAACDGRFSSRLAGAGACDGSDGGCSSSAAAGTLGRGRISEGADGPDFGRGKMGNEGASTSGGASGFDGGASWRAAAFGGAEDATAGGSRRGGRGKMGDGGASTGGRA